MEFSILDNNWSKFEKKMNTITKRYARMGHTFSYEILGHDTEVVKLGNRVFHMPVTIVEVTDPVSDGRYEFAASIDHLADGNVIRGMGKFEIPTRFQSAEPVCDHCGTSRGRKSTYLVYDNQEDKFLQLGKSCLNEVVGNISAEGIAAYESMVECCDDCGSFSENCFKSYVDTKVYMMCAVEAVDHFGFVSTACGVNSTKITANDYYNALFGIGLRVKETLQEMKEYDINPEKKSEIADKVIEWCRTLDSENEYLNNLHVVLMEDYFDYKYMGLVASAYTAYLRQGEYEKKIKAEQEKADESEWVGEEGERIEVEVDSWRHVTSSVGFYGTSFLYQFITADGQAVNWWTSKYIDEDKEIKTLRGTVKKLDTYKGRKITVVTRCRLA